MESPPCPALVAIDEQTDTEQPSEDYVEPMRDGTVEESILEFCVPCATRGATRACEIRAFLEGRVGTARSRAMVSKAKITVAQDHTGRKNKALKYGPSLLKLRA